MARSKHVRKNVDAALTAEEAVDAVCRQFNILPEELAATGEVPPEDLRAARAACGLLSKPLGLSVARMAQQIDYPYARLLQLRSRYWANYRYDRRNFRPHFRALCQELGVPSQNLSELRRALGFKVAAGEPDELIEAVCDGFALSPEDLRLTDASPTMRQVCAVYAVLARKTGMRLRRGAFGRETDRILLCDLGRCLLQLSSRRGSSQELKELRRGYQKVCRRLGVDEAIPGDCEAARL